MPPIRRLIASDLRTDSTFLINIAFRVDLAGLLIIETLVAASLTAACSCSCSGRGLSLDRLGSPLRISIVAAHIVYYGSRPGRSEDCSSSFTCLVEADSTSAVRACTIANAACTIPWIPVCLSRQRIVSASLACDRDATYGRASLGWIYSWSPSCLTPAHWADRPRHLPRKLASCRACANPATRASA